MKYGIQANFKDGCVKWVKSTRWNADLTDDITDIALFFQETTAITAVKTIRKDGKEPKDCTLEVVEIDFKIQRKIPVEYPPVKEGYLLVTDGVPEVNSYFNGTKGIGQYTNFHHFGNIERATVFKSEATALARKEQLITDAVEHVKRETETEVRNYYLTEEQRKAQHENNINTANLILSKMQNLKVIKV